MVRPDQLIDALQTTALVVLTGCVVYVIVRLEREIRVWITTMDKMNARLAQQNEGVDLTGAMARAFDRIVAIEERLSKLDGVPPPTPPHK